MTASYSAIIQQFFHTEKIHEYSLDTISRASAFFWHPHTSFKSIHIAGTNGKGSVARMIFQMLHDSGKSVGIYTSPHITDIRERFQTNRGMITQEDFCLYAEKILSYPQTLSYFERCVLLAFLYFHDQNVEYAVIEVGMGGRLDATNIITPILSIITSISLDHTEFLGDTIEAIAREKGGIIKTGIPVILWPKCPAILTEIAKKRNSPILPLHDHPVATNLIGKHQQDNAKIAHCVGKFLQIESKQISHSLMRVYHPWRLQYVAPNIIIDGAHNIAWIRELSRYIQEIQSQWENICNIFTLKENKSIHIILDHWQVHPVSWGILDVSGYQLQDAASLQHAMTQQWYHANIMTPKDIQKEAKAHPQTLYVIFGSLYMLHEWIGHWPHS